MKRTTTTAVTATITVAATGVSSLLTLAIALVGMAAITALEQRIGSPTGDTQPKQRL